MPKKQRLGIKPAVAFKAPWPGEVLRETGDAIPMKDNNENCWWGKFEIPASGPISWMIGPLALSLESLESEWILNYHYDTLADEDFDRCIVASSATPLAPPFETERFVGSKRRSVSIVPALADRSVVSRPEVPFRLLPGESVQMFIGTPLWFRIEIPEQDLCIWEMPLSRPSDTWFGPSTQEGEFCYATRTGARLRERDVPIRPFRAVTPITLSNSAEDAMLLERINLPVPLLSAFHTPHGNIWTNAIELERQEDGDMAELKIKPGPPASKRGATLLCKSRIDPGGSILRTLSSLLG